MMDTYMNTVGHVEKQAVKGVVTGKPVASRRHARPREGHRPGRSCTASSSGRTTTTSTSTARTYTVQGFGNVGSQRRGPPRASSARRASPSAITPATSTTPRASTRTSSRTTSRRTGSIAGYPGGKADLARGVLRARKADIFVPARSRTRSARPRPTLLDVKLVAEGANGPLNPEGERCCLQKGIAILPDVLANSGGVTVSYYEWVQNKRSESWTLEEVDARLETAMKRAYREVVSFAREKSCDLRVAAYALALQRIEAVYREREIFP